MHDISQSIPLLGISNTSMGEELVSFAAVCVRALFKVVFILFDWRTDLLGLIGLDLLV